MIEGKNTDLKAEFEEVKIRIKAVEDGIKAVEDDIKKIVSKREALELIETKVNQRVDYKNSFLTIHYL